MFNVYVYIDHIKQKENILLLFFFFFVDDNDSDNDDVIRLLDIKTRHISSLYNFSPCFNI